MSAQHSFRYLICCIAAIVSWESFGYADDPVSRGTSRPSLAPAQTLAQDRSKLAAGAPLLGEAKPIRVLAGEVRSGPTGSDRGGVNKPRPIALEWYRLTAAGRHTEAKKIADTAIAADPTQASSYLFRASSLIDLGMLDDALKDLDRAIQLNTSDAIAYSHRAYIYETRGDWMAALADWEEAVRLEPKNLEAFCSRSVAKARAGDPDGALADLDRSLKDWPASSAPRRSRGAIFMMLGKYREAEVELSKYLSDRPKDLSAQLERGQAYFHLDDFKNAAKDFDQAVSNCPSSSVAYAWRAWFTYSSDGSHAAVAADYRKATELAPGDAHNWVRLAWLFASSRDDKVRDGKSAVEAGQKACELTEWKKGAYLDALGAAYAEAGRFDAAMDYAKRAIEMVSPAAQAPIEARLELYKAGMPFRR